MNSRELTPAQSRHFEELSNWVSDVFGVYAKFFEYQEAFNTHFQSYQDDVQKKLDLESLRHGLISCAPAALVTGIWWQLQHEHQAEFMIQKRPGVGEPVLRQHVYLALPTIKFLSNDAFVKSLSDPTDTKSPLVVDFTYQTEVKSDRKFELTQTPIAKIPQHFTRITGTTAFAQHRYQLFNYHPEYPSPLAEASASPSTDLVQDEQLQK